MYLHFNICGKCWHENNSTSCWVCLKSICLSFCLSVCLFLPVDLPILFTSTIYATSVTAVVISFSKNYLPSYYGRVVVFKHCDYLYEIGHDRVFEYHRTLQLCNITTLYILFTMHITRRLWSFQRKAAPLSKSSWSAFGFFNWPSAV